MWASRCSACGHCSEESAEGSCGMQHKGQAGKGGLPETDRRHGRDRGCLPPPLSSYLQLCIVQDVRHLAKAPVLHHLRHRSQ